jgi:hypothetical protein
MESRLLGELSPASLLSFSTVPVGRGFGLCELYVGKLDLILYDEGRRVIVFYLLQELIRFHSRPEIPYKHYEQGLGIALVCRNIGVAGEKARSYCLGLIAIAAEVDLNPPAIGFAVRALLYFFILAVEQHHTRIFMGIHHACVDLRESCIRKRDNQTKNNKA